MKSSKLFQNVNLKRVSILSLMILSLSVGMVRAADEVDKPSFKLWHDVVGTEEVAKEVLHMNDANKKNSVEWLVTDRTVLGNAKQANVESFVKMTVKEPFKFVEALKEVRKAYEEKHDGKLKESFVKDLRKKLAKVEEEVFGSRAKKEAFLSLFDKIMAKGMSFAKGWLKELFKDRSLLNALNLTEKDPNPKASPTPSPSASPTASATPSPSASASPSPSPVVQGPQFPGVGEQSPFDDQALRAQAQQICDRLNGQQEEELAALKDQFNTLQDQLKNELTTLAEASNAVQPNRRNNDRGLEDVLPGLLANAVGQQEQDDITPANNSQPPFFPQQQQRREQNDPALNQPLPDQGNVQPQASFPLTMGTQSFAPIRGNVPSLGGKQELRDVRDVLWEAQNRTPVANSLGMNAGLPELVMAKARLSSITKKAQGALMAAKDKLTTMEEKLEELKDGAKLPTGVRNELTQLERAVQEAKNQQQMLGSMPEEQRAQLMPQVLAQIQTAEANLKQRRTEADAWLEENNAFIQSQAKTRDNLQAEVRKLESEVTGMKEEEASIQQLVNMNMQMQMAPQAAGVSNVNRLTGVGGGNRSQAPRFGNSLQTLPTAAKGATGDVRGPLAGGKK